MRKYILFGAMTTVLLSLIALTLPGCDKERIVTTTEKVTEIEYITLPPDTVIIRDTVVIHDGGGQTVYIHDTTIVLDTVVMHDVDTVSISECAPLVHFAYVAMQAHLDAAVLDLTYSEYGYSDGWIFYLSIYQNGISNPSTGVYDFYGYIDFWSPEWDDFIPLDYGMRMTYNGGDASDPNNWTMSDAPSSSSARQGGMRIENARKKASLK